MKYSLTLIIFLLLPYSKDLILTETNLGNLKLNSLKASTVKTQIKEAFPNYRVERKIGQQDGPDYIYYEVKDGNDALFFVALDGNNNSRIDKVVIESDGIQNKYKISVGSTLSELYIQHPNITFATDLHYNIYAYPENSKHIIYRLNQDFKVLNDSVIVESHYGLHRWQLNNNHVEYMIWSP